MDVPKRTCPDTPMVRNFKAGDKGMTVRTSDGEEVGTVDDVAGDMAQVKPNSSLSQSVRNRIGWTEDDQDTYELRHSKVEKIENREVHLKD